MGPCRRRSFLLSHDEFSSIDDNNNTRPAALQAFCEGSGAGPAAPELDKVLEVAFQVKLKFCLCWNTTLSPLPTATSTPTPNPQTPQPLNPRRPS